MAEVIRVRAKVIEADAVELLDRSADRVEPACGVAGPGGCGGCDLQHASPSAQVRWKAAVIGDALHRQGGFSEGEVAALAVTVRPLPQGSLGWRIAARWHATADGRPGFRRWHRDDVIAVESCPVLAAPLRAAMGDALGAGRARLGTDGAVGEGRARTEQRVRHRRWSVSGAGFWQGHIDAASVLVDLVLDHAAPAPGQQWWDLYAGAGLFAAFLGESVGPSGRVLAVESSPESLRDARRALHDLPQVQLRRADAAAAPALWAELTTDAVGGIVLDPPRSGAGEPVVRAMAASGAGRIVAVSCDPVTFARDARLLRGSGYDLTRLDALDAFPMTHHVETVATFTRR